MMKQSALQVMKDVIFQFINIFSLLNSFFLAHLAQHCGGFNSFVSVLAQGCLQKRMKNGQNTVEMLLSSILDCMF